MLKISANDAQLTVVACGPITSDRIDLPCEITLSKEFDGLAVTVVFKAGEVQRDVAMLGSPVHVPAECLEQAGEVLMVGIWAGDGSGRPTIPTVWASAGTIRTGVLPSGYDPDEPEPDWAAQVQQAAAQAVATANSVRADADAGVFDGADGYSPSATVEQLADGATITITDKDGITTATVHDGADGRDGRDGTDGVDGYSPAATVTQTATGATISITDKSGTTTASVSNGTDGTDGTDGADGFSPTVDVQPITGGHEVTITDADGAHSFDVMDGDPATPGSITDAMLAPDGVKAQVAQLWGNQLVGELSGTIDTAADACAAPPMALTVEGVSTQAGTPTPDAPVPILSVDDLSLVVAGQNLLPSNRFCRTSYNPSAGTAFNPESGAPSGTVTDNGDGTFTMTASAGWQSAAFYSDVLPAGEYHFKVAFAGSTPRISIGFVDADTMTYIGAAEAYTASDTVNKTYNLAGDRIVVFFVASSSTGTVTITQPQLELGSTATAYEPYQGTTVPDLLPDGTLRSLPDGTKDELALTYLRPSSREGWAWYQPILTKRCEGKTFDGTDMTNWSVEGADRPYFVYKWTSTGASDQSYTGLSDNNSRCSAVRIAIIANSNNNIGYFNTNHYMRFRFRTTAGETVTVADLAAYFVEHPTTFVVPMQEPVTTTLDPIELPELPAPTATVWCDGGSAQPTYSMQYVQDTNLVIAELRAALADLATS